MVKVVTCPCCEGTGKTDETLDDCGLCKTRGRVTSVEAEDYLASLTRFEQAITRAQRENGLS